MLALTPVRELWIRELYCESLQLCTEKRGLESHLYILRVWRLLYEQIRGWEENVYI